VATGLDRSQTQAAAARRRLDALGGALRCHAVLGQSEQVRLRDAEIRVLLAVMDDGVRRQWEEWLNLAAKPMIGP
jgi:hypothetical protein